MKPIRIRLISILITFVIISLPFTASIDVVRMLRARSNWQKRFGGMDTLTNIIQYIGPMQLLHDGDIELLKRFVINKSGTNISTDHMQILKWLINVQPTDPDLFYQTDKAEILSSYAHWNDTLNKYIITENLISLIHPLQLLSINSSNHFQLFRDNIYAVAFQMNLNMLFLVHVNMTDFQLELWNFVKNVRFGGNNYLRAKGMFDHLGWEHSINILCDSRLHSLHCTQSKHAAVASSYAQSRFSMKEINATLEDVNFKRLPSEIKIVTLERDNRSTAVIRNNLIDLSQIPCGHDIQLKKLVIIATEYVVKFGLCLPPNLEELVLHTKKIVFGDPRALDGSIWSGIHKIDISEIG